MQNSLIGTKIDNKFLLQQVLGEGGLGVVYKAKQEELSRYVAIKILHQHCLSSEDNRTRFDREAKILSTLQHPNIVSIYNYGDSDELCYIAMEYLEGKTLTQRINEGFGTDWKKAVEIVIQLCDALQYAHSKGIIHRDLKPQNIILQDKPEPDFPKILDFGLSRITIESGLSLQKLTQTGTVVGSVQYMSPESCLGQKADARSDIYSLACILYECLAGRPPLQSDSAISMLHKQINETPKALPLNIPKYLSLITFKALEKRPEDRFQTMAELANALKLVLEGRDAELNKLKFKNKDNSNNSVILLAATLAVLAVLCGAVFLSYKKTSDSTAKEITRQSFAKGRQAQIDRAISLAKQAQDYMAQNNVLEARVSALSAITVLSKSYKESSLNANYANQELAILGGLVPILIPVRAQSHYKLLDFSKNFKHNNNEVFDTLGHVQQLLYLADLDAISDNLPDSVELLHNAFFVCVVQSRLNLARELLSRLEKLPVQTEEQKFFKDVYIEIEKKQILLGNKTTPLNPDEIGNLARLVQNSELVNPYHKCKMELEICRMYNPEKNRKELIKLLKYNQTLADEIFQPHPDLLGTVGLDLARNLIEEKEYDKAKDELLYLKKRLSVSPNTPLAKSTTVSIDSSLEKIRSYTQSEKSSSQQKNKRS